MLKQWRSNKKGVLYVYVVIILALFAVGAFAFFMANGVATIQHALNPHLSAEHWATSEHYAAFDAAANFVTYIWVFFVVFLVVGLAYWGWTEAQRRQSY